jgi:hypothetical protein
MDKLLSLAPPAWFSRQPIFVNAGHAGEPEKDIALRSARMPVAALLLECSRDPPQPRRSALG